MKIDINKGKFGVVEYAMEYHGNGYNFVQVENDPKIRKILDCCDISASNLYVLCKNGEQVTSHVFYFKDTDHVGQKIKSVNTYRYSWLVVLVRDPVSHIPVLANCIFDSVEDNVVYIIEKNSKAATIYKNLLYIDNKFVYLPSMEIVYDGDYKLPDLVVDCDDRDGFVVVCENKCGGKCKCAYRVDKTTGVVTKL